MPALKLLFIAVLIALASTLVRGQEKRCEIVTTCAKSKPFCSSHDMKDTKRCHVWGEREVDKKIKKCVDFDKTVVDKCTKCKKYAEVISKEKESYCKEYKKQKICKKFEQKCIKFKSEKKCYIQELPTKVIGPTTCPAGKQLQFTRNGNVVTRSCGTPRTGTTKTCVAALDPHMSSEGKNYEFQHAGDFKFTETDDGALEAHVRLHRFSPSWTGTIAFAVRVNGQDIVQYSVGGNFKLNGKSITVADKKTVDLPNGGSIVFTQASFSPATIEIYSPNGGKLLFHDYSKTYGNLFIYLPSYLTYTGVCTAVDTNKWATTQAAGLFDFKFVEKEVGKETIKYTARQEANAKARCEGQGLKDVALKNCIFDVLNTPAGHKEEIIQIEKHLKEDKERGKRPLTKLVHKIVAKATKKVTKKLKGKKVTKKFKGKKAK